MKRIFKGPWLWIVLAVVGVLLALQYLAPNGGYDEITTSEMSEYIATGEVKEITFVDGDQQIKATLDDGVDRDGGNEVHDPLASTASRTSIIDAGRQAQVDDGHDREVQLRDPPAQPARLDPRHAAAVRR